MVAGSIVGIVGVETRLAAHHKNAISRLHPPHTRLQLQVQNLLTNELPVGGGRTRSNRENLERTSPIYGQLRLQLKLVAILLSY